MLPWQMEAFAGVMVGTAGNPLTVTVAVTLHPLLLVYVIMLVPADTAVTSPDKLTVAIAGEPETHGFVAAGVPEPVNWLVAPWHTARFPEIVGRGLTVTVTLPLILMLHPVVLFVPFTV